MWGSSLRSANTANRRQMGGVIRDVGLEHTPGRGSGKGGKYDTQVHLLIHLERRFQVRLQQLGPRAWSTTQPGSKNKAYLA